MGGVTTVDYRYTHMYTAMITITHSKLELLRQSNKRISLNRDKTGILKRPKASETQEEKEEEPKTKVSRQCSNSRAR